MPRCALALVLAVSMPWAALAQETFPSRAAHIVVPFTPGTGADILARLLGARLSEQWKTAVVVDNRAGATGNIGADLVAKSAPDGYTLLFTATSFATNPPLSRSLPFDPVKSFVPVSLVAAGALAVLVSPQVPAANLREFIALAKREPGKLHYASPGTGGVQHLAMELLKLEAGINIVHVPYKGLSGALSDLAGGHVQAAASALQSAAPQVQSGKIRMLGVMSAARSPAFPDVPTLAEQGLPGLEVDTWYALFAPAGTPAPVVAKWNADLNRVLAEPAVRAALEKQGMAAVGGEPRALAALLAKELERWSRVVAAAGIKAE
jgi:tripartite-type tricarboxylate transporter receptor subunit TctC